jgi:copper chaperone NosL
MRTRTLFAAVAALAAAGCGSDGPPTVRYGKEECGHCRMIVNDDRFAAAARTPSGDSLKYDDVCCLVDHAAADPGRIARKWVRGYRSGRWHEADAVYFVFGPKLQTPMGSGLAAVETQEEADALAAEWGGQVLRFPELKDFLDAKTKPACACCDDDPHPSPEKR